MYITALKTCRKLQPPAYLNKWGANSITQYHVAYRGYARDINTG